MGWPRTRGLGTSVSGVTWLRMPAAFSCFSFSLFKRYICIFIYGCAGSLLLPWSSSPAEARGLLTARLSLAVEQGPQGVQASVVATRGLQDAGSGLWRTVSCSTARGIFPDQGLNPCPLCWQVDSLSTHKGSPCLSFYQLLKLKSWEEAPYGEACSRVTPFLKARKCPPATHTQYSLGGGNGLGLGYYQDYVQMGRAVSLKKNRMSRQRMKWP